MKTPWLCLATLAAADTGRILCVVPSRWPPSRSLEAVASTWLKDCDDVAIAVSARQFNASHSAAVARRKSARKFITRNVAVTHDGAGFTPWLPIRSAVEYAAARRGFDWLAMVEDDSVLHLKRLRAFLGRFSSSEPLTFGQCACERSPGMHFFSRAALDQLRPVVGTCEPGRYKAQSAGDVALLKCLDRANLTCTPAVDTRGDALISAMRSQRKPQMLRLLEATRAGRRHCEAGKPSEPCTKGCWGGGAFGFHGKPLKNHFLVTHFYRALVGK
jgi:hypothetical protein